MSRSKKSSPFHLAPFARGFLCYAAAVVAWTVVLALILQIVPNPSVALVEILSSGHLVLVIVFLSLGIAYRKKNISLAWGFGAGIAFFGGIVPLLIFTFSS
ncbi:MAG: hypothetical protein A3F54_04180 [Candidatus Kerfeldbacteria bacterium RIFCSPHIGHO2_12_FULL_48_17]|uniref:Uncharacterized protein n=1 Tax=Candidatus Kerfeldbacteria bacterium RIFCSPHIGHO2_12_FULL_48_17 TaxID=1798542 RepID=A0A1G2B7E0_9BACT|nr:MAG: hypothetical protein A3F54_04180 [Candidatus Kerfeldbacteria bacterium RIFCSPHIGHO2_12_FULL_48_17]